MILRTLILTTSLGLILFACSSSSSSKGGNGGAGQCTTGNDCPAYACTCNDGTAQGSVGACVNGSCLTGSQVCDPSVCSGNGGLKGFAEEGNVVGSAECNAFCAKALSLHCPQDVHCGAYAQNACGESPVECDAAKKPFLTCIVQTGTWTCDSLGNWSETDTCSEMACSGSDASAE